MFKFILFFILSNCKILFDHESKNVNKLNLFNDNFNLTK